VHWTNFELANSNNGDMWSLTHIREHVLIGPSLP